MPATATSGRVDGACTRRSTPSTSAASPIAIGATNQRFQKSWIAASRSTTG